MIEIVGKEELAKRKPYKLSSRVLQKMMNHKKLKKEKMENSAKTITTINDLAQNIDDDILKKDIYKLNKNNYIDQCIGMV